VDEPTKRANQRAMDMYNYMWSDQGGYAETTRRLYAQASRNPQFGCHLQDEVLRRLGATVPGHKTRKRYGVAATAFIDHMMRALRLLLPTWKR